MGHLTSAVAALVPMITIDLATGNDAPYLPEIERSADRAFLATAHAWIVAESWTEFDSHTHLIATNGVRVARTHGEIVGFIITAPLADALHIYELAVRHEWQRRGIGRALMDAAHAAAAGFQAMTLTTFTDVPFNAPFYARLGFDILTRPPAHLAAILDGEAKRGLTNRCVMRAAVSAYRSDRSAQQPRAVHVSDEMQAGQPKAPVASPAANVGRTATAPQDELDRIAHDSGLVKRQLSHTNNKWRAAANRRPPLLRVSTMHHLIHPRHDLSPDEIDAIEDSLYDHNRRATGRDDGRGLGFVMRGQAGRTIGIAAGYSWAGTSEIKQMWVDEAYRGRGYGQQLLNAFTVEAAVRGVRRIWVASYDFQAPGFYEKAGFKRMAEFAGWPEGQANIILCKTLAAP